MIDEKSKKGRGSLAFNCLLTRIDGPIHAMEHLI